MFDPSTIANKILFIGEDRKDGIGCKDCDDVVCEEGEEVNKLQSVDGDGGFCVSALK